MDLSQVWIDLHAFGASAARLQSGQPVTVRAAFGELSAETTLDRVLPIAAADSQSVIARVRLPNTDHRWRPGLAVSADVVVATRAVQRVGVVVAFDVGGATELVKTSFSNARDVLTPSRYPFL